MQRIVVISTYQSKKLAQYSKASESEKKYTHTHTNRITSYCVFFKKKNKNNIKCVYIISLLFLLNNSWILENAFETVKERKKKCILNNFQLNLFIY